MLTLKQKILRIGLMAAAVLFTAPAIAHSGASYGVTSFSSGFFHPFSGWDHALAMLAVGLWLAQLQRPTRTRLLLVFPAMMIPGAMASAGGLAVPGVEPGIAASLVVSGLLVAFALRMPGWFSASLISFFAVLHGYAHGSELQSDVSLMGYGAGFVCASLVLQAAGLFLGAFARKAFAKRAVRMAGAGVAIAGVCLLAGVA
ncbi:HupE/UreJ family protein [soil metagenome]